MKLILNGTDISDVVTNIRSEVQTSTEPSCNEYGGPVWETYSTGALEVSLDMFIPSDAVDHDGDATTITTPGFRSQEETVWLVMDGGNILAAFHTSEQAGAYEALLNDLDDYNDERVGNCYVVKAVSVAKRNYIEPKILHVAVVKFPKNGGEPKVEETAELISVELDRWDIGLMVEQTGKRRYTVSGFKKNEVVFAVKSLTKKWAARYEQL